MAGGEAVAEDPAAEQMRQESRYVVGHAYASTTAIYTGVSDDYRNRLLERSLKERHSDLWEEPA
ncbi:hypothetical protein ACFWMJ_23100 [Streptomyces hawaiiensis]|uniref:hypothetical protein n=1 Tax=Streptomyces hawaiiensis TaxID=67305 RepID=UPI0036495C62